MEIYFLLQNSWIIDTSFGGQSWKLDTTFWALTHQVETMTRLWYAGTFIVTLASKNEKLVRFGMWTLGHLHYIRTRDTYGTKFSKIVDGI